MVEVRIVDRRYDSKKKSAVNRGRFIRRFKGQIRKAVADAIAHRGITDIDNGEKIGIPAKDISEPQFGHGRGGVWTDVLPGQRSLPCRRRNRSSAGRRQRRAAAKPARMAQAATTSPSRCRARNSSTSSSTTWHCPIWSRRNWRGSRNTSGYAPATRRPACRPTSTSSARCAVPPGAALPSARPFARPCAAAKKSWRCWRCVATATTTEAHELRREIARLRRRIERLPFIDTFDLRYNNRIRIPDPVNTSRDVLPDGCIGIDGRREKADRQALLHAALPVPDAHLRAHRSRLHSSPHAGLRGQRG